MKRIAKLPAKFLILLIRLYQVTLSPFKELFSAFLAFREAAFGESR